MKRLLYILLTFTLLLPTSVFAGGEIKPGPGHDSHGNDTVIKGGKFESGDNNAGWLLHVQPTDIPVKAAENPDADPVGYQENLKYWTTHFPNTDPNRTTRNGYYILPSASSKYGTPMAMQQFSNNVPSGHFQLTGQYSWMQTPNDFPENRFGKNAWTDMQKSVTDANPSPRLPEDYWRKTLSVTDKAYCTNLMTSIFSSRDQNAGITDTKDIKDIIDRVDYYLGKGSKSDNNPATGLSYDQRSIYLFLNYCGFLATAIRTLPDSEQPGLAKQLDDMCQGYFNGSYTPMCVTAELVVPSEFGDDGNYGQNFWTIQQALYNTQHKNWPDSNVSWEQISATKTFPGESTAAYKLTGSNFDGKGLKPFKDSHGKTIRWYGDLIHSVDESILSKYGIKGTPVRGYGVFGLTSALTPPGPPPPPNTADAKLTAQGSVGLLVEEKKYEKKPGDYSETFKTTMTVNLGSSYSETDTSGHSSNGAGFANVLGWLANKRAEGKSFPNPTVTVYLQQANALPAISGDRASQLIDRTNGYYGDGNQYTDNSKGQQVSATQEERRVANFTWNQIPLSLSKNVILKDPGIPGLRTKTVDSGIQLEFTDLKGAYDYFQKNNDTLILIGEIKGKGNLPSATSKNQHWFKVGANVHLYGPQSLNNMDSLAPVLTNLRCTPKYDYSTITAYPNDQPYFYSRYQQPYSEFKEGTVPSSGTGSDEKFNSMTGTPTFTDTSTRTDFTGTPYEKNGHYYQYFASGGSEFVVQFDGQYVQSANATRHYSATYTPVYSYSTFTTDDKGNTIEHRHNVSDNFSWSQQVKGFSYVKIKNLKVWKLSEARLDGTRELLDTNEVKATVKANAPSVFYNVAGSDTSSSGRLVYSYRPTENDNVNVVTTASDSDRYSHTKNNVDDLKGYLDDTVNATCVSDYIVLRTSNGDQSILYYEYKSKNEPKIGKVNGTSVSADPILFDQVPYATIWTGNSQTSKGGGITEDSVTYGGYNGNYSNIDTKYKSSGSSQNINLASTEAVKNASGAFPRYSPAPTKKFRLLNDQLVIPDTKQNGAYILGNSEVFYENIIDTNPSIQPNYPIVAQADFGGKRGFVVKSTYSPSHDKINDVVVYNPVSNQNAMVVSLPEDRDQRVKHSVTGPPAKPEVTGDYVLDCNETDHLYTEADYQIVKDDEGGGDLKKGETKSFGYGSSSITLAPGKYHLVVNGAAGGGSNGGAGGTSAGDLTLSDTTTLYITCGYGGGNGSSSYSNGHGYSGGGATHIATAPGSLSNLSGNRGSVLLVAGGGGGGSGSSAGGGPGGGSSGGDGEKHYGGQGYGGTQNGAGASGHNGTAAGFGYGGSQPDGYGNGGGGGGGGWYGGGAGGNDYPNYHDNDDSGGGGGSGHIGSQIRNGSSYTGSNNGGASATIYAEAVEASSPHMVLKSNDPHKTYSYNWKLYTYGLKHTSGTTSPGRSDKDKTPYIFPTGKQYTPDQCANGYIVRMASGDVELTTSLKDGISTYSGKAYSEVLSKAQDYDRTPDASEWTHYPYGDPRCWKPVVKKPSYVTEVTDGGKTYKLGSFINLDYGFQIYFPNTGDFQGTGARWSSYISGERGAGYVNGMDTTEWIKSKWVEFPFAVLYNNVTYLPHERIYLDVPKKLFDFYVPLQDSEMANAEIKYGTIAINTQNGDTLECGSNADHNIQLINYAGKDLARHHNADRRSNIDVVGRIGNMTLEDTGDFRFSNFFKKTVPGWIVPNIVQKVDITKQNNLVIDPIDVRGEPVNGTGVGADTYGSRPEKRNPKKLFSFPLTPAKNNLKPLQKQPVRIGYDSYFDLTTLGNYYGNTKYDTDGKTKVGQDLVLIKPHYFRLDLDTGASKPVDVYMNENGNYVKVNDASSNTVTYNGADADIRLNWRDEAARRNFNGDEIKITDAVQALFPWIITPSGSAWTYGNYNILNLTDRNRTFIGTEYTYGEHKDPSNRLVDTAASLQGGRWHFNLGLPSSSVFVYAGEKPTQDNIDKCKKGSAVVYCALEVYAQGEVWTLIYDGSHMNQPFTVVPGGKAYDPQPKYPDGKGKGGEQMPIVAVYSIDKSSKLDLNVTGTH